MNNVPLPGGACGIQIGWLFSRYLLILRDTVIVHLTVSGVFSAKGEFSHTHAKMKTSLGQNLGESLLKSLGLFLLTPTCFGNLLFYAQRSLSGARESDSVSRRQEGQTEDKD